jgi:prepilin-type processing-associated H-X9-DG protein
MGDALGQSLASVDKAADDAVLDAMVLSACADGMVRVELEALARMAKELPSLAGADEATITDRIRQSFERVEKDGTANRLQAIGAEGGDEAARRRIFSAAATIQFADGHVSKEENEFLRDLAQVLRLDEITARRIVGDIERELRSTHV